MGSIKSHLTFALKVLVAILIINFIVDILSGFVTGLGSYIQHPYQTVRALIQGNTNNG